MGRRGDYNSRDMRRMKMEKDKRQDDEDRTSTKEKVVRCMKGGKTEKEAKKKMNEKEVREKDGKNET